MSLKISAEFLFGYYQGHDRAHHSEKYPSIARLQSAFISAAYSVATYDKNTEGSLTKDGDVRELPEYLKAAVEWFESNPPDAISFPNGIANETGEVIAFRNKEKYKVSKGDSFFITEPQGERAVSRTALDGPVIWWWQNSPDHNTFVLLKKLSTEIAYLGEVSSPVKISVTEISKIPADAYQHLEGHNLNYANDIKCPVPICGRADFLQREYLQNNSKIPKKEGSHLDKSGEFPLPVSYKGVVTEFYRSPQPVFQNVPWQTGTLLQVEKDNGDPWIPLEKDYLRWAVVLHRALVKICGDNLPIFLGGKRLKRFNPQLKQPANGLSIQILSPDMPLSFEFANKGSAFLLMFPNDAQNEDIALIKSITRRGLKLYGKGLGRIHVKTAQENIDLTSLWKNPDAGNQRWWRPYPLYVSDSRPPSKYGQKWTIADAMRVSIGYVFRDKFHVSGNSDQRQLLLSKLVTESEIEIIGEHSLHPENPNNYIHHMNKGSFFLAGTALINFGELLGKCQTAALAIGQTRHLSGGFLVPIDIPVIDKRKSDGKKAI